METVEATVKILYNIVKCLREQDIVKGNEELNSVLKVIHPESSRLFDNLTNNIGESDNQVTTFELYQQFLTLRIELSSSCNEYDSEQNVHDEYDAFLRKVIEIIKELESTVINQKQEMVTLRDSAKFFTDSENCATIQTALINDQQKIIKGLNDDISTIKEAMNNCELEFEDSRKDASAFKCEMEDEIRNGQEKDKKIKKLSDDMALVVRSLQDRTDNEYDDRGGKYNRCKKMLKAVFDKSQQKEIELAVFADDLIMIEDDLKCFCESQSSLTIFHHNVDEAFEVDQESIYMGCQAGIMALQHQLSKFVKVKGVVRELIEFLSQLHVDFGSLCALEMNNLQKRGNRRLNDQSKEVNEENSKTVQKKKKKVFFADKVDTRPKVLTSMGVESDSFEEQQLAKDCYKIWPLPWF